MKDFVRSASRAWRLGQWSRSPSSKRSRRAGIEAVNPALAGTTSAFETRGRAARPVDHAPTDATRDEPFFAEHVNVKADRFEAFRSRLEPGTREIVYYALATTPGDFAAPAPRAEEMYAPETFGRGAAERFVVESAHVSTRGRR